MIYLPTIYKVLFIIYIIFWLLLCLFTHFGYFIECKLCLICVRWQFSFQRWTLVAITFRNDALNVVDLEETIHELQDQLAGLGMSPSIKPMSSATRASSKLEGEADATVMFSRMDTERNQKALKRGINSQKVRKLCPESN